MRCFNFVSAEQHYLKHLILIEIFYRNEKMATDVMMPLNVEIIHNARRHFLWLVKVRVKGHRYLSP